MHTACDSKNDNLQIANELQAAAQNETIQNDVSCCYTRNKLGAISTDGFTFIQVTEQDIFMANMIAGIVIALSHLQNSDESQHVKATELLNGVVQDLNVFSKSFVKFSSSSCKADKANTSCSHFT